jgi:hypothetical protein
VAEVCVVATTGGAGLVEVPDPDGSPEFADDPVFVELSPAAMIDPLVTTNSVQVPAGKFATTSGVSCLTNLQPWSMPRLDTTSRSIREELPVGSAMRQAFKAVSW